MNTGNGTQTKILETIEGKVREREREREKREEVVAIVKTRGQERFFGGHQQPFAVEERRDGVARVVTL